MEKFASNIPSFNLHSVDPETVYTIQTKIGRIQQLKQYYEI